MFYAQHGEDSYLLKLVGNKTYGFYVDVGAWHPTIDSVTKHFYNKGWSGINIEPVHEYAELLRQERPRDTTFELCASDNFTGSQFYQIGNSGLSTLDPKVAESSCSSRDFETFHTRTAPLEYIFCNFLRKNQFIDFLKIDVEGAEEKVLRGNDWWKYRPRILCIEGTFPLTNTPNWQSWLPYILAQDYVLIRYDGLNLWFHDRRQNWPDTLATHWRNS